MGSPALSGTNVTKMRESIDFSERNRALADVRMDEVIDTVSRRVRRTERSGGTQSTMSNAGIAATAETQLINDKYFNSRVNDEQWGARLGTLYGVAELAERVPQVLDALGSLLEEQRKTNQLLRQLLVKN